MPFPLFRLPLVASINVIKSIDIEDFFPLTRTSTKMRKFVKISRVPIELFVKGDKSIEFKKLSEPGNTKKVELFLQPDSMEPETIVPFEPFVRRGPKNTCVRNLAGYRRMMDDFVDIFRVESVDFNLVRVDVSGVCVEYLEYAIGLGLKIKNVTMSVCRDLHNIRKLLSACAHTSGLTAYMHFPPKGSVLDSFRELAVDNLELVVAPSGWIKLDHLFALVNCLNVRIHGANVDEADLSKFLKHWLSGTVRMKTLAVKLGIKHRGENAIDAELVMEGIPRRDIKTDPAIDAQLVMEGIPGRQMELNHKFEIERSDGVKTIVWIYCICLTLGDIDPYYVTYN